MGGIAAVFGSPLAVVQTQHLLLRLQHRGLEACGLIIITENGSYYPFQHLGLAKNLTVETNRPDIIGAVAHVSGFVGELSRGTIVQPFGALINNSPVAISGDGKFTNGDTLYQNLLKRGATFRQGKQFEDFEILLPLVAQVILPDQEDLAENPKGDDEPDFTARFITALTAVQGAYAIVCMTPDKMIVARDPYGLRPLSIGRGKDTILVASETSALDLLDATEMRDVAPGEIITVSADGSMKSQYPFSENLFSPCAHEIIFKARPDSIIFGHNVAMIRETLGKQLAEEHPAPGADIVVPIPDSGTHVARGYAGVVKLKRVEALTRSRETSRPDPSGLLDLGIKAKLGINKDLVRGQSVVLVDDCSIGGNTGKLVIDLVKKAGARSVHIRFAAPSFRYGCHLGGTIPAPEQLIAATNSMEAIRLFMDADSIGFMSEENFLSCLGGNENNPQVCIGCMNGKYPLPPN